MAPRSGPYPPILSAIISSTLYPPLPSYEELESLRSILQAQSTSLAARIETDPIERERLEKRIRKEKKRKEREQIDEKERERLALEANERAGAKLEAAERARVGHQQAQAQAAAAKMARKAASPAPERVKKERHSLSPVPSAGSSSRPQPQVVIPITYGAAAQQKMKKKKRVVDSDDEQKSQGPARDRSTTLISPPPPQHNSTTSGLKLKLSSQQPKSRPSYLDNLSPTPPTGAGAHIDFSLPPQPARPLIPPRPGVSKPLKPGPKRQSEVDEDFSNTKAPNQVAFTTFWSSVEPYLRDVREDDLAMLGFKADAPESYDIPPRGRHYTEVWDEEDGQYLGTTPRFPVPNLRQPVSHGGLPLPHFVPSTELRDENLVDEHRGLGSLTERIVAGFMGDAADQSVDNTGKMAVGEVESNRDSARVDVVELEDRMKRELRAVMLLGEHEDYDPSSRDDDEVTSALRQCQRALHQQTAINEARKARLAEIARHRLAYADYQSALEGIEKSIEAGWAKRIKKYGVKKGSPGSSGVGPRPPVPENLKRLVEIRKGWIETVGKPMAELPQGVVSGLPTRSVFEGIGEESEERDEKIVEEVVEVDSMDVDEVEGVA